MRPKRPNDIGLMMSLAMHIRDGKLDEAKDIYENVIGLIESRLWHLTSCMASSYNRKP
jgi:hypothetical protein